MPTKSPTSTCQVVDSNLAFTRWTRKPQRTLKTSSIPNNLHSNTLLWTSIAPTLPSKLFALGRITSPQVLPAYQYLSPSPTGVASPTNVTSQSTCFVPVARILFSLPLRPWKVPIRLMLHPWLLLAPKFLYTSNQLVASHGVFMPPTVGTLVPETLLLHPRHHGRNRGRMSHRHISF
jgi:hypothetical protein